MSFEHERVGCRAEGVRADDVALAVDAAGVARCAWSAPDDTAGEGVYLEGRRLTAPDERAFRPALTRAGEDLVAAACVKVDGRYRPVILAPERIVPPSQGQCFQVRLSGDRVAWEERDGGASRAVFGRIDLGAGAVVEREVVDDARSPDIDGDDRVFIRPSTGGVVLNGRELPDAGVDADMPVVARGLDRLWCAWHARAGDGDLLRWLRLRAGGAVVDVGPISADLRASGTDQGWEFPALTVAPGGVVALAGRSAHGWRAALVAADGEVLGPRSISPPGWGGRGRTCALAVGPAGIVLAHREWDEIRLTALRPAVRPVAEPPGDLRPAVVSGVLFGDLHQHAAHSDGCGTAEDLHRHARDDRGLDFHCLTEHDRFCRRTLGPATWDYLVHVADAFHEPGRFVTLRGWEYTGPRLPGPGHKCVYFGDDAPDRLPGKGAEALLDCVRRHGGVAVPHHVGWTGAGLDHHDPVLQPVWEICSVHGAYECHGGPHIAPRADVVLPGQLIRDALEAGCEFGLIASSDSHGLAWHHGLHRRRDPFAAGLAALPGAEPTREGVLDALKFRRCYATSGARIGLRVDADGGHMGEDLGAGAGPTRIAVEVDTDVPVRRVTVVCDGREESVDNPGAACAIAPPARPDRGRHWALVRVLRRDGEVAWSSPLFWGVRDHSM